MNYFISQLYAVFALFYSVVSDTDVQLSANFSLPPSNNCRGDSQSNERASTFARLDFTNHLAFYKGAWIAQS